MADLIPYSLWLLYLIWLFWDSAGNQVTKELLEDNNVELDRLCNKYNELVGRCNAGSDVISYFVQHMNEVGLENIQPGSSMQKALNLFLEHKMGSIGPTNVEQSPSKPMHKKPDLRVLQ